MKRIKYLVAAAAILTSAACNADKGTNGATATQSELPTVQAPANGDWSQSVIKTPEGGFLMGNPQAKVRLIEFGSMTCPHCAEFDETGVQPLIDKYVKTGQVSWEFRNYVRDGFDLAASLVARCNGAKGFFPMTRALYADQSNWLNRIQGTPQPQLEALQGLPPNRQFLELAKVAGFQQFAAMRGVPEAKSAQCLSDENAVNQLVQMTSDVTGAYPGFSGTPSFVINGELLERTATWQDLEPKLKTALGERG
ncbi:thioredoxin domain-containing protein [Sphingomonas lutea]|uniref:Thioredoxin domain-containing protein n=1 Tax=Sphingomonas lutea TaxID=1045317 RepID=A0A7G9SJN3_9SPHN|nr:thioredoxin domain-containing protein [Sphingomonas lutea]QNN68058.1 thioredoxin domain-containing protein [Sphingomonas lutea]